MTLPPAPLAVLLCSQAFAGVWPKLAYAVGATPRVVRVGELPDDLAHACGVLVAAAGVEKDACGALEELQGRRATHVAVVGADHGYRAAVAVLRAGAEAYFVLPDDLGEVRAWMRERVEHARRVAGAAPAGHAPRERYDFGWLLGWSPPLQAALERAASVIPHANATVLITGETGTGKELLARAIHQNGPRRDRPFVEVNCNALPATLLEAELFGYERGAFTDARVAKPGLLEAADGGTLFLDEVGDLSAELQGKLLRVLENKRVRRLGSVRDVEVNVRIIAATHANMVERTRAGLFRPDLYYRLNVVPIHIPPLRARGEDILFLTHHFLERLSQEYGVPCPVITPEIRRALSGYGWPGNVRELRNSVERALVLGNGSLRVEDLLGEEPPTAATTPFVPFPATMDEIERAAARAMVAQCAGNKTQAAERLGISRKRLYALLGEPRVEANPSEGD